MHILILGASGRTGLLTLAEAISRNYTVTVLVRRPESISTQQKVSVITGTPESKSDIAKAFDSAPASDPIRAVISTLNNGRASDSPWAKPTAPTNFLADCTRKCLEIMRERGCKKMVCLGAAGVGSSRANTPWFFKLIVDHSNIKIAFVDHFDTQQILEEEGRTDSTFKWVHVRAAVLSDGQKKEVKYFSNDGRGGIGAFSKITRNSVASFLIDCVESDRWDGQTPVISN